MPILIIGYVRVSTKQQGDSGLGLEAQTAALHAYAKSCGGRILKINTEVETGKRANRPELEKALAHARRSGATLVIAKLDRLARNVHFLSGLMESGVDFVACDNPHANRPDGSYPRGHRRMGSIANQYQNQGCSSRRPEGQGCDVGSSTARSLSVHETGCDTWRRCSPEGCY